MLMITLYAEQKKKRHRFIEHTHNFKGYFPFIVTTIHWLYSPYCRGFPGVSDSKESSCSAGDEGSSPGLERSPGEGRGNPLQCSFPGEPHGQRSLEGYSPWRCIIGYDWVTDTLTLHNISLSLVITSGEGEGQLCVSLFLVALSVPRWAFYS